ncbi:SRPBCC family protein [Nocardioides campestrisoli]|uniref:SRPBCC family protein n=1 Tax=Nocardioides campestrisoli TaxID=2736757 RepID=UPI0015E700E1|nr:SRPBCC family protein [Nocardioides campestrisoli]
MVTERITASAWSAGSADRLWALASDVERWPDRLDTVDSVRELSSGPTQVGSRFEVRQPGLPRAVWEVTDWQARSFTWVSSALGIRSTAVHSVREDHDGASLDLSLEWTGPLTVVMSRLLGGRATGMVEHEAVTFARLAERETPEGGLS